MQTVLDYEAIVEENELPPQIENEEDMALNEVDKAWIKQEIQAAHKRSGLGKLTGFIKDWSGTGAAGAILLLAFTQWSAYTEFRTHANDRLDVIEKKLSVLGGTFAELQLNDLSNQPLNGPTVKKITSLVASAIQNKENINPEALSSLGQKIIQASDKQPDAWVAALAVLDYKSFANQQAASIPVVGIPAIYTHYRLAIPTGMKAPTFRVSGNVPEGSAARFNPIGDDRNYGQPKGNAFIFGEGGNVALDGMQLRNVVLRNVKIFYGGGPLIMENVYFVNCTFEMQRAKNTFELAESIISPEPATTFSGE